MCTRSKLQTAIFAIVMALCSCAPDTGREDVLKPYVDRLGEPIFVEEEAYQKVTFYRNSGEKGPTFR